MRRYEDFTIGDVYRSAVGRTVTETDNLLFTMLALNTSILDTSSVTGHSHVVTISCA